MSVTVVFTQALEHWAHAFAIPLVSMPLQRYSNGHGRQSVVDGVPHTV